MSTNPTASLAKSILDFDAQNPGEPESEVVVPYSTWADWIDLAGAADAEEEPI
jgi:hypothetical protein